MVFAWIAAIVIFSIIEAATTALVCIWFVFGAVAAFITALFTTSPFIQLTVFVVVSVATLIFTRPVLKKKIHTERVPTNADRVIGCRAIVTEPVSPTQNGRVSVDGLTWAARSADALESGQTCIVLAIEGATLVVAHEE